MQCSATRLVRGSSDERVNNSGVHKPMTEAVRRFAARIIRYPTQCTRQVLMQVGWKKSPVDPFAQLLLCELDNKRAAFVFMAG